MFIMIKNSEKIITASKNALSLCACTLVPSIFPFMTVAAVFINYSSDNSYKLLSPIFKSLFGTSSYAVSALIPGMLCGYPVGANCVCQLYKKGSISKSEAESLIAYSNNSGPLFIIGAVGVGLLGSSKYGTMLYLIHISAAVICGIILKPFTESKKSHFEININLNKKNFTDCIADTTVSILKVCGFVVIFAVINELVKPITSFMPKNLKCLVSAFLELTNGANVISHISNDTRYVLILMSAALGWSGLSVHMQVKSIISDTDLSMKKYYISRLLSAVISALISFFVFRNTIIVPKDIIRIIPNQGFVLLSVAILVIALIANLCKKQTKKASR